MVTSWYQCLLQYKAVHSSPKEQGERKDPQPDSFAAVGWADCPGCQEKSMRQQDKECVIF